MRELDDQAQEPSRRVGAVLVVLTLLAGAVGAAIWSGLDGDDEPGRGVAVGSFTTFDPPPGSGGENDDLLVNLTDGDPNTSWVTETYRDPDVTVLKPGVGLVATLETPASISAVEIASPSANWSAAIHLVNGDVPGDIGGWGEAAGTVSGASSGTVRVDLDGREATSVMVWFTHVGDDRAVQVDDFEVFTR
jgi:putative peptidoglycan lipid II flippase